MFHRILVPLDASAAAARALPFAEALAGAGSARLLLVQAVNVHTVPGADPTESQVLALDEAQAYLDGLAARISDAGITVETAVPYGPAAEEIVTEARLRHADLIVMTTHGRTGLGRWVYGSVAEAVLAHSPVPVLLLQSWLGEHPWRRLAARPRLLVPLDGSEFSEAALPVAFELIQQLGGELLLMEVVTPVDQVVAAGGPGGPIVVEVADVEALLAAARQYLDGVAGRLSEQLGAPPPRDLRVGDPAQMIADTAREHGVDLIVMSTHGRTGLARTAFGSVAGGVLRHASAPLLLVHPADVLAPASLSATASTGKS